jgi:hypothetical protein
MCTTTSLVFVYLALEPAVLDVLCDRSVPRYHAGRSTEKKVEKLRRFWRIQLPLVLVPFVPFVHYPGDQSGWQQ